MRQVARVVIGCGQPKRQGRSYRAEFDEEFADVPSFRRQLRRRKVGHQMSILLEMRSAAGGVGDDRIDAVEIERRTVGGRELAGGLFVGGVVGERSAAALGARDHYF